MSTQVIDYNLAAVQATLAESRITGFGETDAISLTPMSDVSESVSSADGAAVAVNAINDPRWEGSITVQYGSEAYDELWAYAKAQITESKTGKVSETSFMLYDPISGLKVTESNLRFMRLPDISLGKS